MRIENLTLGQKKALLESLEKQKSKKTPPEVKTLNDLREFFAEPVDVEEFGEGFFKRCGDFIKMIDMDTFGENYRNNWVKLKETSKGEYFTSFYTGGKRIYLK